MTWVWVASGFAVPVSAAIIHLAYRMGRSEEHSKDDDKRQDGQDARMDRIQLERRKRRRD